ncbi:hypothetical protein SDC9_183363 [bioreactor metagenome]|uniref:Uncharacterized protein n=1 Tax=bioreactor metagenome TaxID=1076179 RepID=A0A645HA01_9ZZZZ
MNLGDEAAFDTGCYMVVCQKCGHNGPIASTRAAALAAWATENRAAERKLIARIGELETALAAEKDAHQKLRAAAQAVRSILAEIEVREDDCAYTTASIGRAYQLLDQALDAETEAAKC